MNYLLKKHLAFFISKNVPGNRRFVQTVIPGLVPFGMFPSHIQIKMQNETVDEVRRETAKERPEQRKTNTEV